MIAQVLPFTFDREFAATPPAASAGLEREHLLMEVEHLRQELARAEERARAEGEAAALERYRGERDTALLAATDALQASLEAIEHRFGEIETELGRGAAQLALAAADHIAGRALEREPAIAVDEAIARVLAEVRRGTPLEVRVSPSLVEPVEAMVAARQARDRRALHVTVIGDPSLPCGDARLLWEAGGAALDREARRNALVQELERTLCT